MIPKPSFSSGISPLFLQKLLIVALGFWVYSPALQGDWLWDDNFLITDNPLKNDPAALWKIWTQPGVLYDYYPITYTVQRLQWWLWGTDTLGYHLTNVVLHVASALLIWRLFSKLGLRLAWWGGLIFAVHPAMVESVAWIAELKNTLSLPPFLLAMCFWIDSEHNGKRRDYLLSLGFFLVAILCKTTMFVLPVLLLLQVWWKRGQIDWRSVKASLPFFVVAVVFVAIQLAHTHDVASFFPASLLTRLALVGSSLAFYLSICLWPVGLAPLYPQWTIDPPTPQQFFFWPILAGFLVWFWTQRQSWGRHALLGSGFFLITLGPFAGFLAAPTMMFTWVMDHFLYIPIIGIIGLVVAGIERLETAYSGSIVRPLVVGIAATATALLALEAHAYAGIFRNSETLWTYGVQQNPKSWMTRASLGEALLNAGQIPEAIDQLETALKINPSYINAHYNLARAYSQAGRSSDSIAQYEQVVKSDPKFNYVLYTLGMALVSAHQIPEATERFEQLLQQNPNDAAAHFALGDIDKSEGKLSEATDEYAQASAVDPGSWQLHFALGNALIKANRLPEALAEYQQAAVLNPQDLDVLGNLGVVLARMGRIPEAAQQFEAMLQIDPNSPAAHTNMGSLFLTVGKFPEAIAQYQEALRLKPDFAEAQQDLARAQAMQKAHALEPPP